MIVVNLPRTSTAPVDSSKRTRSIGSCISLHPTLASTAAAWQHHWSPTTAAASYWCNAAIIVVPDNNRHWLQLT